MENKRKKKEIDIDKPTKTNYNKIEKQNKTNKNNIKQRKRGSKDESELYPSRGSACHDDEPYL
ncbi:MAG: hypothetical protein HFI76_08325 [Lachnospiraceae bacterium]|nr:hypothetical protein [Lachnospiraceae bacterium]